MKKIKRGDTVIVIAGKEKGRQGTVSRVTRDERVFVAGLNMVKKHVKPNPNRGISGGIEEREASLHVSNVMLINPETQKAERIKVQVIQEEGKKVRRVRYFKSTNTVLD